MKPVIKKQSYYTLLLMKDDSPAHVFRMHGTVLKILFYLFLLFLLAGAASVAGGVYFFNKYLHLTSRNETQEKELTDVRLQLERLVNFESLLMASAESVPLAKNDEVGASAPPARIPADAQNAEPPAQPDDHAPEAPATQADGQPEENATAPATDAQSPSRLPLDAAESPLRINGFQARGTGKDRMRISYELLTAPSDGLRTIAGSIRYCARLANGSNIDLVSYDIEGKRFAITRMKPILSSVRMPQGYLVEHIDKLAVIIELVDGTVYQEFFGLAE